MSEFCNCLSCLLFIYLFIYLFVFPIISCLCKTLFYYLFRFPIYLYIIGIFFILFCTIWCFWLIYKGELFAHAYGTDILSICLFCSLFISILFMDSNSSPIIFSLVVVYADSWFLYCCCFLCSNAASMFMGSWSADTINADCCRIQFDTNITFLSPSHSTHFLFLVPFVVDVSATSSIC